MKGEKFSLKVGGSAKIMLKETQLDEMEFKKLSIVHIIKV